MSCDSLCRNCRLISPDEFEPVKSHWSLKLLLSARERYVEKLFSSFKWFARGWVASLSRSTGRSNPRGSTNWKEEAKVIIGVWVGGGSLLDGIA